jgi:hypothetical protein
MHISRETNTKHFDTSVSVSHMNDSALDQTVRYAVPNDDSDLFFEELFVGGDDSEIWREAPTMMIGWVPAIVMAAAAITVAVQVALR